MSGHSKWATIKRKKGVADAKRGQVFTRLTREIVMAAREGGGDIDSNFRLRLAVDKAKAQSMPKDNIERALKRASGEGKEGEVYEEVFYEGYGPNGVAIIIQCVTENRNRTVAEIRHMLTRSGGNMGEVGSVSWQFRRAAVFSFPAEGNNFDKILNWPSKVAPMTSIRTMRRLKWLPLWNSSRLSSIASALPALPPLKPG